MNNMGYPQAVLDRMKETENTIENWRQKVEEDPHLVAALFNQPIFLHDDWRPLVAQALGEYERGLRNQEEDRARRAVERDEEELNQLIVANSISTNSNISATISFCITAILMVVTIVVTATAG